MQINSINYNPAFKARKITLQPSLLQHLKEIHSSLYPDKQAFKDSFQRAETGNGSFDASFGFSRGDDGAEGVDITLTYANSPNSIVSTIKDMTGVFARGKAADEKAAKQLIEQMETLEEVYTKVHGDS